MGAAPKGLDGRNGPAGQDTHPQNSATSKVSTSSMTSICSELVANVAVGAARLAPLRCLLWLVLAFWRTAQRAVPTFRACLFFASSAHLRSLR